MRSVNVYHKIDLMKQVPVSLLLLRYNIWRFWKIGILPVKLLSYKLKNVKEDMLESENGISLVREAPSIFNISSLERFPISDGTPPVIVIHQYNQFDIYKCIIYTLWIRTNDTQAYVYSKEEIFDVNVSFHILKKEEIFVPWKPLLYPKYNFVSMLNLPISRGMFPLKL